MQDDTRTGVRAATRQRHRLLAINPSWYARTYTGARAEIVQIPLWVKTSGHLLRQRHHRLSFQLTPPG